MNFNYLMFYEKNILNSVRFEKNILKNTLWKRTTMNNLLRKQTWKKRFGDKSMEEFLEEDE